eukprot:CCRYP_011219-RA/>CCRYP_011219-RA protein AED:0.13 eAED:0.29 QI:0/0/0/1/1/1/2/0/913
MNNVINRSNSNGMDDDVMSSLGKVLSSVNLVGEDTGMSYGVHTNGHGNVGNQQQQMQAQQQGARAPAPYASNSWSGVVLSSSGGSSGLSYGLYSSGTSPPNTANDNSSLQNVLYDSGIYEHSSTPPPQNVDRERKQSIDIFLSQSPSKSLGEDAFRVMNRTVSNPALVNLYPHQENSNSVPGLKPLASTAPSSRSESPQASRAGLIGTGNSPYTQGSNRQLGFIPSTNSFPENSAQSYGGNGMNVNAQLQAQFGNNLGGGNYQPSNASQHQHQPQAQQFIPVPMSQQQTQVFYMAVPAPDGNGQVLQPVQMVQIPGQPPTLMVPANMGSGQSHSQVMTSPSHQNGVGGQLQQQSNLFMQASKGANGLMSSQGSVYAQDSSSGSANTHYSYGNEYQQSNGYEANPRYQGKNDNTDSSHVGQYQLDNGGDQTGGNNLSMLYSSPHRPPLRALLGNVRRLSRDQVGCRLLQQALDEDGPTAATAILNEGLTFWAEAMVDPFGNYLFQKILERITPEERVILVKSVSTRLVNASLNLHGTRSVQKIVEVCAVDEEREEANEAKAAGELEDGRNDEGSTGKPLIKRESAAKILSDALKPSAARLCIDSHGNHAIQRILLKLPYQYTSFIFDAVAASVEDVARHRHGCCVIQRCLDSRHSAARSHLVSRIVEKSLDLMQDAYGNYVVQYVLDVCGDEEVHAICESVIGRVCLLAIQKFSSNVMEKCLERCTDRVREEYLNELNDSDKIRELMMDPFGNYVVQRALSVSTHSQAIRLVETMKPHLASSNGGGGIRNTAGGRRILGKICRRFPNFVLEGETFDDYDLNQVLQKNSPHNIPSVGGRRGSQNSNGGYNGWVAGNYPNPGPSPNQRRGGRGNNRGGHLPHYQQQQMHHVNVQQADMMTAFQPNGNNPFMFPPNM